MSTDVHTRGSALVRTTETMSNAKLSLVSASIFALTLAVGCGEGDKGAASASATPATSGGSTAAAPAKSAAPTAAADPSALRDVPKDQKSITAKFCLGPDGNSQDCAISCKVDRDKETCALWAEKTKAICGKISKKECQDICEKDENPTACEIAKTMK